MNIINQSLRTVKTESPILYRIVQLNFLAAFICFIASFVDERTLMGLNVWIKPLKFFVSTGIYIFTVGYLITFYPYSTRKKHIIRNIVSWTLLFEVAIIGYQGARGVQSHYNQSSLFDGLLFGTMGILIGINVLIMVVFLIDTIRLKLNTTKSIQWAILLGWVVVIFGSWVGGQMISQVSHNVGVADGGEGLPLLNWSTIGGDLRVAHFFALHALQIIPLFALLLTKKWDTKVTNRVVGVTIFALLFAGWIGFTFYQAKQGIPLINN